eukprot:44908-Eustigmatos_ZCMA.PRE.1
MALGPDEAVMLLHAGADLVQTILPQAHVATHMVNLFEYWVHTCVSRLECSSGAAPDVCSKETHADCVHCLQ